MRYDSFEIISNIVSSDAQSLDPLFLRPVIATRVADRIFTKVVRKTIDLNGETSRFAKEVEDERSEGMLASKL